jgi:hypothetical protein
MSAPTYYIAKVMAGWLQQHMELPYRYNVISTLQCAEMLLKLKIQPTHKMLYHVSASRMW